MYASGAIGMYDISGATPTPLLKVLPTYQLYGSWGINGCLVTTLDGASGQAAVELGTTIPMSIYDMRSGNLVKTQYQIPMPAGDPGNPVGLFSLNTDGSRLYLDIGSANPAVLQLVTYELNGSTATQISDLSETDSGIFNISLSGSLLLGGVDTGVYYPSSKIYDISGATPVKLGNFAAGYITAIQGTTAVSRTEDTGMRVFDLSDPQHPVMSGNLFSSTAAPVDLAMEGHYLFTAESDAGVGIWDLTDGGGMIPTPEDPDFDEATVPVSMTGDGKNAYVINSTILGVGEAYAFLFRYDLTQNPPARTSNVRQYGLIPEALALSGTMLYEGTTASLSVLDVSGSGDPVPISSLNTSASALARLRVPLYWRAPMTITWWFTT